MEDIDLYNEILKKYEELNKTDPPCGDLAEKMQRIRSNECNEQSGDFLFTLSTQWF